MNIIKSGSDIIKTLPSGESFNVEAIEDWNDLLPLQRVFLNLYMDSLGQVEMARIKAGVSKGDLTAWDKDPKFTTAQKTIDALFTEGLSALDYLEAVTNGKVRGRVLQARRAKGYEPKQTTTNKLTINTTSGGFGDIIKALQPG